MSTATPQRKLTSYSLHLAVAPLSTLTHSLTHLLTHSLTHSPNESTALPLDAYITAAAEALGNGFHQTDSLHFAPGLANHRINLTFLFARRSEGAACRV